MLKIYNRKEKVSVQDLKAEIGAFYNAGSLATRLLSIVRVIEYHAQLRIQASKSFVPMDEDITKIVAEFERIAVAVVTSELGDNARHINKIRDLIMEDSSIENIEKILSDIEPKEDKPSDD
jgi:hypothetical protein